MNQDPLAVFLQLSRYLCNFDFIVAALILIHVLFSTCNIRRLWSGQVGNLHAGEFDKRQSCRLRFYPLISPAQKYQNCIALAWGSTPDVTIIFSRSITAALFCIILFGLHLFCSQIHIPIWMWKYLKVIMKRFIKWHGVGPQSLFLRCEPKQS